MPPPPRQSALHATAYYILINVRFSIPMSFLTDLQSLCYHLNEKESFSVIMVGS